MVQYFVNLKKETTEKSVAESHFKPMQRKALKLLSLSWVKCQFVWSDREKLFEMWRGQCPHYVLLEICYFKWLNYASDISILLKYLQVYFSCIRSNNFIYQEGIRYHWTQEQQGYILSSFYIGYLLTHIPGGLLAERFGAKWILSIGILIATICNAAIPLSLQYGSYVW